MFCLKKFIDVFMCRYKQGTTGLFKKNFFFGRDEGHFPNESLCHHQHGALQSGGA